MAENPIPIDAILWVLRRASLALVFLVVITFMVLVLVAFEGSAYEDSLAEKPHLTVQDSLMLQGNPWVRRVFVSNQKDSVCYVKTAIRIRPAPDTFHIKPEALWQRGRPGIANGVFSFGRPQSVDISPQDTVTITFVSDAVFEIVDSDKLVNCFDAHLAARIGEGPSPPPSDHNPGNVQRLMAILATILAVFMGLAGVGLNLWAHVWITKRMVM